MEAILLPTLHFRFGAWGYRICHCKAKIHESVLQSHDEAGPRKRASSHSWHKPCQSTRCSSVSNLLAVTVGQVLWSSNVTWFWAIKAKEHALLVWSLTKDILEGSCLHPLALFQQPKSYSPSRYLPLSLEGPQWVQGTPATGGRSCCPAPCIHSSPGLAV